MFGAVALADDDESRRILAAELESAGIRLDKKNIDTFVEDLTEIRDNINTQIQRNEELTQQEIISYSSAVACISIILQGGFGDHPGKATAALIALGFTNWRGDITKLLSNIIGSKSGHEGPPKKSITTMTRDLMKQVSKVAKGVYNKIPGEIKKTIGEEKSGDIEKGMGNVTTFAKLISSGFLYVAANVSGVVHASSAGPSQTLAGSAQASMRRRFQFQGPFIPADYTSDPGPNGGPRSGASHAASASRHSLSSYDSSSRGSSSSIRRARSRSPNNRSNRSSSFRRERSRSPNNRSNRSSSSSFRR
jgi:hypothetical protein